MAHGGRSVGASEGRKRERVRARGLRADLVHGDHGADAQARAADLRPRRRCLRDRRGSRRADRGARDRAPRLVGRGAGDRPRSPGTRRAATTVSCCRASPSRWSGWSAASASSTPRRCGRCRRWASTTCARPSPRRACPASHRSTGWLKVSKVDDGDEALADVQLYGQELGAEVEGWPAERVREVLRSDHYFHAMHLPRAFHIHPLNYALGLAARGRSGGRAHLRRHAGAFDRRRRRAQAHRHAVRAACVPAISSWPATSISAR